MQQEESFANSKSEILGTTKRQCSVFGKNKHFCEDFFLKANENFARKIYDDFFQINKTFLENIIDNRCNRSICH